MQADVSPKYRVFSGLQPTGNLTLGNYLGAIKNWVKMQDDYDCLFCIVDQHAITMHQDPITLSNNITTNLAVYIAAGLDPAKSIIYPQSRVSAHVELGWILGCLTPIGWLNRMTQFKDKAGKDKEKASLGLYAYPVLMAADILLYHATHIPVGDDQIQHIELTRDVVGAFNRKYNIDYFKLPKAITDQTATRIMSLKDGRKKMSKSDPSDAARINLIDDNDTIAKKIKKATTDSISGIYFDQENRPEISNLINIYASLAEVKRDEAVTQLEGLQTGQFKEMLTDLLIEKLGPIRDKTLEIIKDKSYIMQIVNEGGERANTIAAKTIAEVKKIVGFV